MFANLRKRLYRSLLISSMTFALVPTVFIGVAEAAANITSTSPLTSGTYGTAYSTTITGTGLGGSPAWSISAGSLPTGLSIASSTGIISGTPTQSGTFNFTVQVIGSSTDTKAFSLTINKATLTVTANNTSKTYGSANPSFTASYTGFLNGDTSAVLSGSPSITSAATTSTPVGTAAITASAGTLAATNYTFSFVAGTLTINKANLTVTANDTSKTYGSANPSFTASYTGFLNGDTSAVLSGSPSITSTATTSSPAGTPVAITATTGTLSAANYTFSFAPGTLTINKAPLTVTANNASRAYGAANPSFSANYSGFQNGEVLGTSDVAGSPSLTATATATTAAGTLDTITAAVGTLSSTNYSFSFVNGILTITTAPLTITANNATKTYGDTVTFAGTEFVPTGLLNSDTVNTVDLASAGAAATATVAGSTYAITPSNAAGTGLSNYAITYVNGALTVNTKALTITANDGTKVYGNTLTFLGNEFTPTGLVNGDTVTSVTLTSPGTVANAPVSGSPYAITPSVAIGTGLTNYAVSYVNGSLTVSMVNPSSISLAASNYTPTYGTTINITATVPADATGTVQFYREGTTSLGAAVPVSAGSAVFPTTPRLLTAGVHAITATYSGDSNYAGNTSIPIGVTVSPATLTVDATGVNKVYDGGVSASATYTDDRVSGDVFTVTGTAVFQDKNVGTGKQVDVTGIGISGTDAGNYTLASTTDTTSANITARPVTVTPVGIDKTYDGTTTAAVSSTDDRVIGDDLTFDYVSANFADKNVGTKVVSVTGISISGGTDAANYSIANPGAAGSTTATITSRTLAITAAAADKTYDGTTAATAVLSDNRVGGDVFTDSYTSATFSDKNVATGKTVTVSGISITGTDAGNYTANTSTTDTADITARTLNVSATGINKVYDGTTSATATLSDDRVGGDSLTVTGTAAFTNKNVGTGKTVNVTSIAISGGTDAGNYTLGNTSTTTTANITAKALTISATGINKVYDATTAATVTLSDDRVSGDVLTTGYTSATFADKNVGTGKAVSVTGISITGGADAGNYTANTTASTTANITQAPMTITAASTSRVYDTANPTFTGSIVGTLGSDTVTATYSTTATQASHTGTYPIVPLAAGADVGNYNITLVNGTLTITKASTTISMISTVNPTIANQTVILSASVVPGTATGTVNFGEKNGAFLGSAVLNASGTAVLTLSNGLTFGSHTLVAEYLGNGDYFGSTSADASHTVNLPNGNVVSGGGGGSGGRRGGESTVAPGAFGGPTLNTDVITAKQKATICRVGSRLKAYPSAINTLARQLSRMLHLPVATITKALSDPNFCK